jgi:hypothetical protein
MDPCAKPVDLVGACRGLRKGRKIGEFSAAKAWRPLLPHHIPMGAADSSLHDYRDNPE